MTGTNGNARPDVNSWLLQEGVRCSSLAELLAGYSQRLGEAGLPVDRSTMGAPLLHPVAQSSYVFWSREEGASQHWFQWTPEALETMRASPIYPIYTSGTGARIRLADEDDRSRFPIGADLWNEGFAEYLAFPLRFSDGSFKALTLATRRAAGFSQDDHTAMADTLPCLALVFESFMARNTARTLMETYVGKRAGLRVLNGEIARGDGSRIDAVIWFSDLRGFTRLASECEDSRVLELLNRYFERITACIEEHDGEVLKFIGDAVLAVFPYDSQPADAVARAESAALTATGTPVVFNAQPLKFGIGLHVGPVFYGNVGGGERLDFTVIGSAVNIASRIESLTAKLDRPVLVSAEFQSHSRLIWESLGEHALKGVARAVEIFSPSRLTA